MAVEGLEIGRILSLVLTERGGSIMSLCGAHAATSGVMESMMKIISKKNGACQSFVLGPFQLSFLILLSPSVPIGIIKQDSVSLKSMSCFLNELNS